MLTWVLKGVGSLSGTLSEALLRQPIGNPIGNSVGKLVGKPVGKPVENLLGHPVANSGRLLAEDPKLFKLLGNKHPSYHLIYSS